MLCRNCCAKLAHFQSKYIDYMQQETWERHCSIHNESNLIFFTKSFLPLVWHWHFAVSYFSANVSIILALSHMSIINYSVLCIVCRKACMDLALAPRKYIVTSIVNSSWEELRCIDVNDIDVLINAHWAHFWWYYISFNNIYTLLLITIFNI